MSQSISLTVPLDRRALTAGAEFLQKLADELESEQLGAPVPVIPKAVQLDNTGRTVRQALADMNPCIIDTTPPAGDYTNTAADWINPIVDAAPVVPTSPPPAGVIVDKNGLPWDERIHSGGENKLNKDGTWRKRKNIPDATVAAVEAELRRLMSASAPADPFIAPPPTDVVTPVITDIAPPPAVTLPPVAVAPTIAPPPALTPSVAPVGTGFDGVIDWPGFMGAVMNAIKTATLTNAEVLEVLKQFGVPALPLVAKRPDLIPQIGAHLSALVLSKQS